MASVGSKKNAHAYECPTPIEFCSGSVNHNSVSNRHKYHSGRAEVRKCHVRYLKSQGYTQIKSDQFLSPEKDTVLVIPRISQSGLRLKGEGVKGKGRYVKNHDSECFIA